MCLDELAHRRDDLPVEEVDDAVGKAGIVLRVRYHDYRRPFLVQLGEELHHFRAVLRVQVTGRLVGKDNLRSGDYRAGYGDALLLTTGELLRIMLGAVADVHPLQDGSNHFLALGWLHTEVGEREFDILEDVQFVYQVEALEDEADIALANLRALLFFEVANFFVAQVIVALGGVVEQAQNIQERGFTATRGAHDGDELAILNFQ